MTYGKNKRFQFPSAAQSILLSVGSIFSLSSVEEPPVFFQTIRAERDAQALGADWNRIGHDLRNAIDKVRKQASSK